MATGLLALPPDPTPTTLVVVAHGSHSNASAFTMHHREFANRGAVAVAMDFRGEWDVMKVKTGWEDTLAATLDLQARFPSVTRTVSWGFSMSGAIVGLAAAYAPPDTYDFVVQDGAVQDFARLWTTNPNLREWIEAETGGTPEEVPHEYDDRSPEKQMDLIRASGVARVYLVHSPSDHIVHLDQPLLMEAALVDAGVPVGTYAWLPTPGHVIGGYQLVLARLASDGDWDAPATFGVTTALGPVPAVVPP